MTITINTTKALLQRFTMAGGVYMRSSIQILKSVRLWDRDGVLALTSTDLDLQNTVTIGTTPQAVDCLIDFATLKASVSACKAGGISLVVSADTVTLTQGPLSFPVPVTEPTADFPMFKDNWSESGGLDNFFISNAMLLRALETVSHAISKEETRYYLNGVYMVQEDAGLAFVATDGHRLARYQTQFDPDCPAARNGIIIPRKTVTLLIKALKKEPTESRTLIMYNPGNMNALIFLTPGGVIESKHIDGHFPAYERVIPKSNKNILKIKARDFDNSMTPLVAFYKAARMKHQAIALNINGRLALSAGNEDGRTLETASDIIAHNGPELRIGFEGKYLADLFKAAGMRKALDNPALTFEFDGVQSPARITSDAIPELTAVLMPLRV